MATAKLNICERSRKVLGIGVALLTSLSSFMMQPSQASDTELKIPANVVKKTPKPVYDCTPDLLLIMPNAGADNDEVSDVLKEAHGTIVGSIGTGKLTCIIYKTEKGHMAETESKFMKDKHFKCISRNYHYKADFVPNDPQFGSQWHLGAINAPTAWNRNYGQSAKIAIFDSGCQASNPDLNGKTEKGYNATTFWAHLTALGGDGGLGHLLGGLGGSLSGGARTDVQGHGTFVATTAAAAFNNGIDTAGVAPGSRIYPVQIAGSAGTADDISMMAGLLNAPEAGCRIVNISYGSAPPTGLTNRSLHAPLHEYIRNFHDSHNGLVFISAGNNGAFDPNPPQPYLNVVSAVNQSLSLTSFSNWGFPVTFTGPGQGIVCSDRSGAVQTVAGTSFSSPIVAAEAALVWSANPGLSNDQVVNILKASCFRAGSTPFTLFYGYGMPDASRAVRMATGG